MQRFRSSRGWRVFVGCSALIASGVAIGCGDATPSPSALASDSVFPGASEIGSFGAPNSGPSAVQLDDDNCPFDASTEPLPFEDAGAGTGPQDAAWDRDDASDGSSTSPLRDAGPERDGAPCDDGGGGTAPGASTRASRPSCLEEGAQLP